MLLDSESFRSLTTRLLGAAASLCAGRLIAAHAGCYSAEVGPFCGLAIIEAMSGLSAGIEDPFLAANRASPGQELVDHQQRP